MSEQNELSWDFDFSKAAKSLVKRLGVDTARENVLDLEYFPRRKDAVLLPARNSKSGHAPFMVNIIAFDLTESSTHRVIHLAPMPDYDYDEIEGPPEQT